MILAFKRLKNSWNTRRILDISKKGGFYFGSSAIGMAISFFTVPIFATFLSEKDFAIFNYCNNLAGFFSFAFSLQFANYYSANYFRSDKDEKKSLTGSMISFLILWNAVFVCIIYGLLVIYCNFVDLTLPYYPYLIFSVLITSITIFKGFYLVKLRLDSDAFKYFIINTSHKIVGIVISIFLMYFMYNHLLARLWGLLIAEISLCFFCMQAMYKNVRFSIDKNIIKNTFKFIYPLLGASLIYFPITGFDQIVLERLNNTSELGYYTLGLTFASYLFVLNAAILQAIEPDIIKKVICRNYRSLNKVILFYLSFCVFGSLMFIQVCKYLINILTQGRFILSTTYCKVLTVSFIFLAAFSVASIILIALQKSKAIFYINLVGCLSSIGSYLLLARYYGFYGVAVGRTIVYIIMSLLAFWFILKEFKRLDTVSVIN